MKIWEAISMACVCGLYTIDEAVLNIELHAIQLMPYNTVAEELKELYEEAEKFKAHFGNEIPEYFRKVEDKLMDYYFKYEASPNDDEDPLESLDELN